MSIRLNRYISESGFCSRREADGYIISGSVEVNGIIGEYNTKVSAGDVISIDGEVIRPIRAIDFTRKEAPRKHGVVYKKRKSEDKTKSKPTVGGKKYIPKKKFL